MHELSKLTYQERLIALGLPSIKYRQIRSDLIQSYKIIHKIDNINSDNFFTISQNSRTRNPDLKLFKPFAKTNIRSNFLPNRINNTWNNLTETTRTAKNILEFKIKVDKELKHLKYIFYN